MFYKKSKINFKYCDLEPFMDEETVRIHYEKHHSGYEKGLNYFIDQIDKTLKTKYKDIENLIDNYQKIEDLKLKIKIRELGGGLINHNFFWKILKKEVKNNEESLLYKKIIEEWGSFDKFKKIFIENCLSLFGSGWVWLVLNKKNELKIMKTFNQDNPWFLKLKPIIGIDLWEHSYYLKYKNDKNNYIENFFNIINWEVCEKLFEEALKLN